MTALTALKTLPAVDLDFPAGIPGLESARRYRLEPLGTDGINVFGRLVSLEPVVLPGTSEVRELALVVAAPGLLWPEYAVEVDDESAELLQLDDAADAVALVVVTLQEDVAESTANLFAPIVLNPSRGLGVQVVPLGSEEEVGWSMHAPLPLPTPA
jgi:flagellar assembly factor FliW